jgi:YopX protein.
VREIVFRGKIIEPCKYQGQWLEGFYAVENGKPFIAIPKENGLNGFYCDPETVGQYTGIKDKNGKKIFEADIVECEYRGIKQRAVIRYGVPKDKEKHTMYGWYLDDNHGNAAFLFGEVYIKTYNYTIIGNFYDNLELIGGKTNG